ncbi:MAG TPA: adenylate/guanylate cyclase domain-containing protein [Promineifilum sp.]
MAGERRVITVLFCDVVDSTALAAQFDPEEWAEVMNEAFRHMIGPVEGYGGMVARLMGDSVLAFFGAPLAHEDDPQRAILAGLGIVTRIRGFARQFEKDYGLSFAVRVGINTGPAVVGEIGTTSAQSGEYTAMGDAINLAARMEQTAVAGTVQISADTYKLVAPLFDVWDLGKVAVKGKDEPVQAYRVLGLEPQPGRWRGLDGPRTPIVGRERELERVRELLHGLKQQHSGICYLIGEAGLGKSRLIAELRHYWRDNLSNREDGRNPMLRDWSEFVAMSYGASQPYDILRRQLRTFCGIRENDPQPVIRERLDALLGLYPEALHERMCQAFIPLLTDTPTEGEIFIQGEAYQRELRQVVVQMVGELMRLGPLVFVVDDVHWADTSSLDILHHLLPLVEQGPILFLFAMRPDRQTPAWQLFLETQAGHSQHCIAVHLEPLTANESKTLIHGLLADPGVPERIFNLVQSKTEGNPLFLEEIVKALLESDAFVRAGDELRWNPDADLDRLEALIGLSDNILALLTARIDTLEAPVRRTLQLASVIGRSFRLPVLEHISGQPAETLENHLQRLSQADLVRPSLSGVEAEYAFRHALTRDAAYETILIRQRRRFHRQVGEAIETFYAEHLTDEAPRLAHHFRECRDWAKAVKYYSLSGEAAARLYANVEALEHYNHALEITDANPAILDDDPLIDLYKKRGHVLEVSARYEEAARSYEELERLGNERGNPALRLEGLMRRAVLYVTPTPIRDGARGRELVEQVIELGSELGREDARAHAQRFLMLLNLNAESDPAQAVVHGEEALRIARERGIREIEPLVLSDIGRAYMFVGRPDDAIRAYREAYTLWDHDGAEPMLADVLSMMSVAAYFYGDLKDAEARARRGLEISRRTGSLRVAAFNSYMLGLTLLESGRIGEGIGLLQDSAGVIDEARMYGPLATIPIVIAWVYGEMGLPAHRRELLKAMIDKWGVRERNPELWAIWILVRDFLDGKDTGRALSSLEFATPPTYGEWASGAVFSAVIRMAILNGRGSCAEVVTLTGNMLAQRDPLGMRLNRAELLLERGKALLGQGKVREAADTFKEALDEARSQGAGRPEYQALLLLARAEPDPAAADDYRRQAATSVRSIAGSLDDEQLRRAFLDLPDVQHVLGLSGVAGSEQG